MTTYTINHTNRTVSQNDQILLNRDFKAQLLKLVKEVNGKLDVKATVRVPEVGAPLFDNKEMTLNGVLNSDLNLLLVHHTSPFGVIDLFNHDRTGSIHISPYLLNLEISEAQEIEDGITEEENAN